MDLNKIYLFGPKEAEAFKFLHGNRDVKERFVKQFVNDLKNGDAEFFPPIIVDVNTNCVADGQHRLTAFKRWWDESKTDTPISVIFKNYNADILDKIIKMNTGQHNWTTSDHAQSNLEMGDKALKALINFCLDDRHPMLHRINKATKKKTPTLRYASAIILGKSITKDIKENKLEISKKEIEYAETTYAEISAILEKLGFKTRTGGWLEHVLTAWYNIRHDKLYNDIIDKCGIENIVANIDEYVDKTTDGTTKEWEEKLKSAIYQISR